MAVFENNDNSIFDRAPWPSEIRIGLGEGVGYIIARPDGTAELTLFGPSDERGDITHVVPKELAGLLRWVADHLDRDDREPEHAQEIQQH